MLLVCNCDGISASRKASKSCFVKTGAGLVSGTGADGTLTGGGEGSEISGDGAGPCPWATAVAAKIETKRSSLCIRASLAVEALLTRLCFWLEAIPNRAYSFLQFLEVRTRPIDLTATGAASELVVVNF